ncbi:leucine-rich repeat domain-containing protein [Coleofasciculus sp. F4-SAH-05]|uniref:leucine-rich repeat domain-containing protein n=1 Tax=Coleofasciculus sp. F4-SAH-05 TaxID=3069525 RepID=UPI0032F68BF0
MDRAELVEIIDKAAREGVTQLDLSGKGITEIPECIGQLTNLKWLYLSKNKITNIPKCIGQLNNLKWLFLDGNKITNIHDLTGQLNNLKWLFLGGNQITEIPECIAQLTNLQKLDLDNNPLNPVVKSAYQSGLDELKAYLRSIQQPDQREEFYRTSDGESPRDLSEG